ncbi:MAG: hypothetical protein KIT84_30015 [Labilithrix sp.]|nr:hypothetical protein [Labilithrix sp.]MCW5815300.1 hypothetical protein [Labilithrix sp.]
MRVWSLLAVTVAVFAVAGACGPSDREVCIDMQTAYCQRLAECSPFTLAVTWGDEKTCAARRMEDCRRDLDVDDTDTTQSSVEDCARALRAATCEDLFGVRQLPERCAPRGDRDDGEPCSTSAQCLGGRCQIDVAGTCGRCVSLGAAGAPCASADDCAAGHGCTRGLCAPLGRAGAPCDATNRCGLGLACAGGVCAAPLALGAECSLVDSGCDALRGHVCADAKCVARTIVPAGAGCAALPDGGLGTCGAGGRCELREGATTVCEAPAADGAACDDVRGPRCLSPAICVDGRCRLARNELSCD